VAVSYLTWRNTALVLACVVAIAAIARMPFWLAYTHAYGNGDAAIWQVWSRAIHEHGFINVLRTADSNNFGYHYVLWPTSAIYARFNEDYELWTPLLRILIKIPPFLCDLALAAVVFAAARTLAPLTLDGRRRNMAAAACALAFALAPAAIYDSMWWSQIDSIITLCTLSSIVLLARGNVALAFAVWTVGFLIKPQPIVVLPALVAFAYWRFGVMSLGRGLLAGVAVALVATAPFVLHGDTRLLIDTYQRMFEQFPLDLAQGAWNFWSIADARGNPLPQDVVLTIGAFELTYARLSLVLFAGATLIVLAYLRHRLDLEGLLVASAVLVFAFYMLPTSTHERYAYPAFAFGAPLMIRHRWLALPYAVLSLTFILNLLAINPPTADAFWEWHGTRFAIGVAVFNTLAFALVMCAIIALAVRGRMAVKEPAREVVPAWMRAGRPGPQPAIGDQTAVGTDASREVTRV
jgi:Gpi18-like mannosyltransferase